MSTALATTTAKSLAATLNIDAVELQQIIVNTVMPVGARPEEVAAFMIVCNTYKLNPLLKQIAAFPTKQSGIMPMVMIDGWLSIMHNHPKFNGMDQFDYFEGPKNDWYVTTSIYVKGLDNPITVTEYFDECYVPPKEKDGVIQERSPWDQWPKRMLRHKSLIQDIRYALGIGGIYDYDELVRIENATDVEIVPTNSYINGPMREIPSYESIVAAVNVMNVTLELRKEYGKDWAYATGNTFANQTDLKKMGFIVRKNAKKEWETKKDVTLNLKQVNKPIETQSLQPQEQTANTIAFTSLEELAKFVEENNHKMEIRPAKGEEKIFAKIDIDVNDNEQIEFAKQIGFTLKKGFYIKDVTTLPQVA